MSSRVHICPDLTGLMHRPSKTDLAGETEREGEKDKFCLTRAYKNVALQLSVPLLIITPILRNYYPYIKKKNTGAFSLGVNCVLTGKNEISDNSGRLPRAILQLI